MTREQIETAIIELDNLLSIDSEEEQAFQNWFERNPIIFRVLGYLNYLPHPIITEPSGKTHIPDFLVEQSNQNWLIFEIKTAQTKILLDRERRNGFYAAFARYLDQCHEYSEAFDNSETLSNFQERYEIKLMGKRPSSILVAGRNDGLNKTELFKQTNRNNPPITFLTYDDIREALDRYRFFHFESYEKAKGFTLITFLVFHKIVPSIANNYICDVGIYPDKDRISIYLDKSNYLTIDVWDSLGNKHSAKSRKPISTDDFGKKTYLEFEVGVTDEFAFLSIHADFKYRTDIRINDFPLNVNFDAYVMCSDFYGKGLAYLDLDSQVIYSVCLTFEDKLKLRKNFFAKLTTSEHLILKVRGNLPYTTENHPLHKNKEKKT